MKKMIIILKKIKEQNDDIKKLKKETMDNKKITKDTLNDAGKKINKFYQEKSKYHNELKYEIERNSEIIKQRNDIFREIARHTRNDLSDKQISINVLNRDIERLINLNHEYIDKIKYLDDLNEKNFNKKNKYKKNINELKDNLSNEKNVRKELNKLYEDLKRDDSELSFEFEGTKTINQILKKNIKAKEEIIKESTDYVEKYNDLSLKFDDAEITNKMLEKKKKKNNDKYEQKIQKLEELEESVKYINIDSKIKDEKQKDINELKNLKDIHEKEIKNLKDQIKNLKDIHEKEIKDLNDLKQSNQEPKSIKKSDQEHKSRKRADQEPKSRKRADHQGKEDVDLPILLSKLNINSSKELISNIKQLINDLYDNEQITNKYIIT